MANMKGISVVRSRKDLIWAFDNQETVEIRGCNTEDASDVTLVGKVQMMEWEDGSGYSFNIAMYVMDHVGINHLVKAYVRLPRKLGGKPKPPAPKRKQKPGTWKSEGKSEESE